MGGFIRSLEGGQTLSAVFLSVASPLGMQAFNLYF